MRSFFLWVWIATATMASAARPVILLIGPPGAGKTTQSSALSKDVGIPDISVDELIAANPGEFKQKSSPGTAAQDPRVDPAVNRLVEEKLRSLDLSNGVIFDGYPAAVIHADYLKHLLQELGLPNPIIIHLQVPDDVVKKRLKGQLGAEADQRLKDYHRELDFIRVYYPEAAIHDIDGTKSRTAIAKEIRDILQSGNPK
jgi:adenylate kinase